MMERAGVLDKISRWSAQGSTSPGTSPDAQDRRALALLLVAHVVCWTVYGAVALGVGALHDDVIEAWNWGQAPQLGYYKHPPLFAWVTWAWFRVFPVADWSFYLLAAAASALGLAGAAALARLLGAGRDRVAAVAFLMLGPLYGFLALKFNANAVLIPVWPWACYWFLRSLHSGRAPDGAVAGVLGALAMLGKYYSALLLLAFLAVALLPRHRARYFKSPAPYVSMAVGFLLLGPHIWWTVVNNYPTVEYALSKFRYPLSKLVFWAAMTTLAPIIMLSLAVAFMAWAAGVPVTRLLARAWRRGLETASRPLVILATLPFLLTLGFGFLGHSKVSLSYTIPIFFLVPLLFLPLLDDGVAARTRRRLVVAALALSAGVAVASPAVAVYRIYADIEIAAMPLTELSKEATRFWRETMHRPLRVVGSSSRLMGAISFYSPDRPLYFIDFDNERAPWVSSKRIAREGMLAICRVGDAACAADVAGLDRKDGIERRVRLARNVLGHVGPPAEFMLTAFPPARAD